MTLRLTAILAALLSLPGTARAAGKELHWKRLDVEATLDAKGLLHVKERQVMVLTGDWNGGERRWTLQEGRAVLFEGMARLDGPSRAVPLVEGDLDAVDHFRMTDASTVRWRARKASDPPFSGTELTYELRYVLTRVVRPSERNEPGLLYLEHDFGMPDRSGVIEAFTLRLVLDPAWKTEGGDAGPITYETENVSPGQSVTLSQVLVHDGSVAPDVWTPPPPPEPAPPFEPRFRLPLLCFAAALLVGAWGWLRRDAGLRGLGGAPAGPVDAAFLDQHVWSLPPEVVGAAWDDKVGSPEVSAVLARMAAEGKIEVSSTSKLMGLVQDVRMKLKVDRRKLPGYENALVAGLFPNGDETSSAAIRSHYSSRGFDPSTRISSDLASKVHAMYARAGGSPAPGTTTKPARWPRWVAAALTAAGVVAAGVGLFAGEHPVLVFGPPFVGAFLVTFAALGASAHARAVTRRGTLLFLAALPLLLFLAFVLSIAWNPVLDEEGGLVAGRWAVLESALFWAAAVFATAGAARSRLLPGEVTVRSRLSAARAWLAAELAKPQPALTDQALPYLIALGLGPGIDRWLRAYGGASATRIVPNTGIGSDTLGNRAGPSGGLGSTWTGGGGAFSGGGASGTWSALASVSAGVSAPSSSSSGSSGSFSSSSSSSSSGGGGGGGW
ncbi:MAG: DUF2207 domain-containing protein [Anaeromyxobacteraceae bacterium]